MKILNEDSEKSTEGGIDCGYFMPNNSNNLEKIFDDAMKKAGFKPIPVGPSLFPLRKSKKLKNRKKK
jgi:hypothetical protein